MMSGNLSVCKFNKCMGCLPWQWGGFIFECWVTDINIYVLYGPLKKIPDKKNPLGETWSMK